MPLIVSFRVRKSYMSNVNYCNLCLKICMENKWLVAARFYWNLTSGKSVKVKCRSNVKSHAGWSIFLWHLSENKCSEQVSENFRNGNFSSVIIFVGFNCSSANVFITWWKIHHFLPISFDFYFLKHLQLVIRNSILPASL